MKNRITASEKIGEIVAKFPKASDIFKLYHIDFCCGGDRLLDEAIKGQGLNEQEVLDKLNSAYEEMMDKVQEEKDWRKASSEELIDHIIQTHHVYLQKELPIISELTGKILRVHRVENGEVLSKVYKLFHELKMELEQHLIKEEEILFPTIKAYEKDPSPVLFEEVVRVMKETEDEHEGAGNILKELRRITDQYTVPVGGCTSFERTYQKLENLEADTFQHIHLENNILFPRFHKNS